MAWKYVEGVTCLGWKKELRATGRAIAAWHRGAARAADLADLRSAVRNIVKSCGRCRRRDGEVEVEMVTMLGESV